MADSTYAFIFGGGAVREAIDGAQVLGRELVWRPQLNLCLHIGQIDLSGEGTRAVVALLGLLNEVVYQQIKSKSQQNKSNQNDATMYTNNTKIIYCCL